MCVRATNDKGGEGASMYDVYTLHSRGVGKNILNKGRLREFHSMHQSRNADKGKGRGSKDRKVLPTSYLKGTRGEMDRGTDRTAEMIVVTETVTQASRVMETIVRPCQFLRAEPVRASRHGPGAVTAPTLSASA